MCDNNNYYKQWHDNMNECSYVQEMYNHDTMNRWTCTSNWHLVYDIYKRLTPLKVKGSYLQLWRFSSRWTFVYSSHVLSYSWTFIMNHEDTIIFVIFSKYFNICLSRHQNTELHYNINSGWIWGSKLHDVILIVPEAHGLISMLIL